MHKVTALLLVLSVFLALLTGCLAKKEPLFTLKMLDPQGTGAVVPEELEIVALDVENGTISILIVEFSREILPGDGDVCANLLVTC